MTEEVKTFQLRVYCGNCRRESVIEIPFRSAWEDHVNLTHELSGYRDEEGNWHKAECDNCGLAMLIACDWITNDPNITNGKVHYRVLTEEEMGKKGCYDGKKKATDEEIEELHHALGMDDESEDDGGAIAWCAKCGKRVCAKPGVMDPNTLRCQVCGEAI